MFTRAEDIANRALQHCGLSRISTFKDPTDSAHEMLFTYDKVRRAEFRRNVWRFATRRVILRPQSRTTMAVATAAWSASEIYVLGSLVNYGGVLYYSLVNDNLGVTPGTTSGQWATYFGPLVAHSWDANAGTAWYAGELVYTPEDGSYGVYMSLVNGNLTDPKDYPAWVATTIYNAGDTVGDGSTQLLFQPGDAPVFNGNLPMNFVGSSYVSLADLNVSNQPDLSPASWAPLPIPNQPDGRIGQSWVKVGITLASIQIIYPLTAGPLEQTSNRNAFLLPNGYLRRTVSDPKSGQNSVLGTPSGGNYEDWVFEGNFITSSTFSPIMLRFVADIAEVPQMDDMFCEALAARMAKEAGPVLLADKADKAARMAATMQAYRALMSEAKTVNAVEIGSIQPAVDDYLACRL